MDPLAYVLGAFPWGQGELKNYDGPDDWQREILTNIGNGVTSIQEAILQARARGEEFSGMPVREATTSGHGIGKSALVAWIILWAQDTLVDTKGVVTANTENQLKTKTWAEVAKWHRLSITADLFKMTATARFSVDPRHERTWRIDMVPWSEKNTEAFAGMHNHGKRILIVFDEASAIPDVIWEVTEGAMTDKDTEIIWAVFGNPTKNTGRFRECFKGGRFEHRWNSRAIDSRTVKISNKAQMDEWVKDYGEDHDFVRVRVRGMFPRVDATSYISRDDIVDAQSRTPEGNEGLPLVLGVDVARYGGDDSVIAPRRGRDAKSLPWVRASHLSTVALARLVFEVYTRYNAYAACVDTGGVGGGVYDQLEEMGVNVYAVDFGSSAEQDESGERYLNKRATIWGRMNNWIKKGGCLPPDEKSKDGKALSDQLAAPTYTYSREVLLQLEAKKDIRKRLGISPDDADALACTFAEPWLDLSFDLSQASEKGGSSQAYKERDPYAGASL
jgi:hypothetical protein